MILKNPKLMLFTVKSPQYNDNRVKITYINSNSYSFTNLINHRYLLFFSLIFEKSLDVGIEIDLDYFQK